MVVYDVKTIISKEISASNIFHSNINFYTGVKNKQTAISHLFTAKIAFHESLESTTWKTSNSHTFLCSRKTVSPCSGHFDFQCDKALVESRDMIF